MRTIKVKLVNYTVVTRRFAADSVYRLEWKLHEVRTNYGFVPGRLSVYKCVGSLGFTSNNSIADDRYVYFRETFVDWNFVIVCDFNE